MTSSRTILHADLDAFFASVAQRDNPGLRGKPVLVGGAGRRGVVAAASYEARRFGVHSAMPMVTALKRCPHAVVVGHDWASIEDASDQFFDILRDHSPVVEGLSVDEAFVDLTGTERCQGDGKSVAENIKRRVKAEVGLICSVGVAPSKYVAKVASDVDKPNGLVVVAESDVQAFLAPLSLARLWGLGAAGQKKLTTLGLRTIGDVARTPDSLLVQRLGKALGQRVAALSRGEDPRHVVPSRRAVSIGHEQTFEHDHTTRDTLIPVLLSQADRVAARLRKKKFSAGTVVLRIKYNDFRRISRQVAVPGGTDDGYKIGRLAVSLLDEVPISGADKERVRLCGVAATNLVTDDEPKQLTFDEGKKQRAKDIGKALDDIHSRFGDSAISRAISIRRS